MRFSLRLNNDLTLPTYVALAQLADQAGFDQLWISHDLFLRSAPVILSAVGMATQHIKIGTGILNPYTIHPAEIAMLAATMDELTGCRFNLGLAAGAADFLKWVGISHRQPLAAMRETIAAIRALLAGERVPLAGNFLRWSGQAYLRFEPPRVTPIYLGAMGPGMLRLAGEVADGVLPLLFPPEHYFEVKSYLAAGIEKRKKSLNELDFAVCIWVSLAQDRQAAQRTMAEKIAYYGPALNLWTLKRLNLTPQDFRPIEQAAMVENDLPKARSLVDVRMLNIGVVGRPEELIARLQPLVEAGARHLSFGPPLGPDPLEAVNLLGQYVLPHFRQWS